MLAVKRYMYRLIYDWNQENILIISMSHGLNGPYTVY